jgi:hypothetical protein
MTDILEQTLDIFSIVLIATATVGFLGGLLLIAFTERK